jgi:multiple sugar transport system substrate-binding protein
VGAGDAAAGAAPLADHPRDALAGRGTSHTGSLRARKSPRCRTATSAITLFKDGKNVAEAWEFAKFFGGPDAEKERIVKNGRTPALRSLQDDYVKILDPDKPPASSKLYLDALEYSRALPITPVWTEMRKIIGDELKPVWAGEKPAKDACAEIVRQVNPLLAQYKK